MRRRDFESCAQPFELRRQQCDSSAIDAGAAGRFDCRRRRIEALLQQRVIRKGPKAFPHFGKAGLRCGIGRIMRQGL